MQFVNVALVASALVFGSSSILAGDGMESSRALHQEDADSNTNYIRLAAPDTMSQDLDFVLPSTAGSAYQVLQTDGAGNLSWGSVATTVTSTRGQLIKRGEFGDEALDANGAYEVVHGDGTDVVSGKIDSSNFFDTGAYVSQSGPGVVKSAGKLLGTNTNDDAGTGDVGEYHDSKVESSTDWSTGSAAWGSATSYTLDAGDWDVSGTLSIDRNSITFSSTEIAAGINGAASATGISFPTTYTNYVGVFPTSFSRVTIQTPIVRVKSDGSNLYINGTTYSSTQTVHLIGYVGSYSSGNPKYYASLRVRRVR